MIRKREPGEDNLGALLVTAGFITRAQLAEAIRVKEPGKLLGETLIAIGAITQDQLARTLMVQSQLRGLDFRQKTRDQIAEATAGLENLHGSLDALEDVAKKLKKGD